MSRRSLRIVAITAAAVALVSHLTAQTPAVSLADYQRAVALQARFTGKATGVTGRAVWLASGKFWYRKSVPGGHTFVMVDPASGTRAAAFDEARMATALGQATGATYTALTLPFSTFTMDDDGRAIRFNAGESGWSCTVGEYVCTRGPATEGGGRGRGGPPSGTRAEGGGVPSPDKKAVAFIRNNNIHVRAADAAADGGTAVTTRGTGEFPYTDQGIVWSPDSTKIGAMRIIERGDRRMVRYVDSSPADQLQPKTFERFYAKPGDALDRQERVLIDVGARRETLVDDALFKNPYNLSRAEWWKDSRAFTFEYNERGHQVYRVIEVNAVNAADAAARTLVEEKSDTFIHYARATGDLATGGRTFRHDLNDGREIIWMSQRDGWSHLYLHDGTTGRVKNQITKGNWMVRGVEYVDEKARQVVFMAGGAVPGQDPYFVQYYRINFDGTGLTPLTTADAYHTVSFSRDRKHYVDTWSRVDLAPVSELRRTADASLVMPLERGDLAPLAVEGWRAPEAFRAKGRDGVTDIYGVIIRPTHFDASRRYPVIENIYAGPHGSFVPKTFNDYYGMQALAELGFIVVQIDGMGTANRSKAFHDVASKNLKDAGFPDRILWHKAVAAKYPYYDVSRVGIYGGSAGGQNAMGALIFHPEFYKAAVAFAGCHDNRMDKIWWNEQWMGWPIGPQYAESSNTVNAWRLRGKLLLVIPELDTNVDPSSSLQVVNALIKANKQFDMLLMPGEEHGGGRRGASAPYGDRKVWDFFVTNLLGAKTPDWNQIVPATPPGTTSGPPVPKVADLFGPTWRDLATAMGSGQ
jgi:dipeptidyl aminopeptidase/acylaminoacyl peptidase